MSADSPKITDVLFLGKPNGNLLTSNAKKRWGWGRSADWVLVHAPSSYKGPCDSLLVDLKRLITLEERFLTGTNKYLWIVFFPLEVDETYLNALIEDAGIKYVRTIQRYAWIPGTLYFEIQDFWKLTDYLSMSLSEFLGFSTEAIGHNDFKEKRIALWRTFWLSTQETKGTLINFNFTKLRINIETITPISSETVNQLLESNWMNSCVCSNWDFWEKIVDISDFPCENVNEFINQLSKQDWVAAIRLDDYMCSMENIMNWGITEEIEAKIIVPEDLPIIAVIDSWISRNSITQAILVENGLDFTSENPLKGNPYVDDLSHGTAVACEIAFWDDVRGYFLHKTRPEMLAVCKILPVKVFGSENTTKVEYEEIFKIGWLFGQKVVQFGIKIVNLSFGAKDPIPKDVFSFSKQARVLDAFAKHYNVIFVVAAWNIDKELLERLSAKYPNFEFYSRGVPPENEWIIEHFRDSDAINTNAPNELLSGISIGSCNKGYPSLFTRSHPDVFWNAKPDVLSIWGWDYQISDWMVSHESAFVCSKNPTYLELSTGTSLSAPRVSRLLAICQKRYPSFSTIWLKCLLLHKASNHKSKNKLIRKIDWIKTRFHPSFQWGWAYTPDLTTPIGSHELEFMSDDQNEISFCFEWKIWRNEVRTYTVPIIRPVSSQYGNWLNNKFRLKLSVCIMPELGETLLAKDGNTFHVSAIAHVNRLSPTYSYTRAGRTYNDQSIPWDSFGVFVPWTKDYMIRVGNTNPTYSEKSIECSWHDIVRLLWADEKITISVRGMSEANVSKDFSVVFSITDLGANGNIKNSINLTVQ